jgi:hypothetical protein
MEKFAGSVEKHMAGILTHWKHRITNAFMEGLNSVFSTVKPRSKDISQGILFVSCPLSSWMLSTISSKVGSLRFMAWIEGQVISQFPSRTWIGVIDLSPSVLD